MRLVVRVYKMYTFVYQQVFYYNTHFDTVRHAEKLLRRAAPGPHDRIRLQRKNTLIILCCIIPETTFRELLQTLDDCQDDIRRSRGEKIQGEKKHVG